MKIAVTGANGFFAWELIRRMAYDKDIQIVAIPFDVVLTKEDMPYDNISFMSSDDVLNDHSLMDGVDVLVHTAFCRKSIGCQLTGSLQYLISMVNAAIDSGVKGFINLSSQSVYGSKEGERPAENGEFDPGYLYALAKCASEMLLESIALNRDTNMKFTNVRLASLIGVSNDVPRNVLYKFICSALNGKNLSVVGGKQRFSFIDVGDAAEAVKRLCAVPVQQWEAAYNIGPEKQVGIVEMADLVCSKVHEAAGIQVGYSVKEDDIQLNAGMNSSLLYRTLDWKPEISFVQTIENTIRFIMNMQEG